MVALNPKPKQSWISGALGRPLGILFEAVFLDRGDTVKVYGMVLQNRNTGLGDILADLYIHTHTYMYTRI